MGVKIRGRILNVDIEHEVSKYSWERPKWSKEKLIACSPFRDERNPSFAVSLETGVWIDSGCTDDKFRKGNFVKLLAFLRRETWDEAEEYLIDEYAPELIDVENIDLKIDLGKGEKEKPTFLSMDDLKPFHYKHPYLERRGLTQKTQRAVKIGYDPESKSIVIPWFDIEGRLVNWKHRSVSTKWFWYSEEGGRIKHHLYGLHLVTRLDRRERVFIVESEIDALTLWQAGYSAVATGSASMSKEQERLIHKAGIKTVIIATDNDEAGERAKKSIMKRLGGFIPLEEVIFPVGRKDINDFTEKELKNIQTRPALAINLGL